MGGRPPAEARECVVMVAPPCAAWASRMLSLRLVSGRRLCVWPRAFEQL